METPLTFPRRDQILQSANSEEKASNDETLVKSSEQIQPWKQYLEEINELNRKNPSDKDIFECSEGLHDHSLAG